MKVWSGHSDALAELAAIRRSQAVIEFQPDGTIISANENFCKTMGYTLDEIVGRHHRIFVDPNESAGADYQAFWARLRDGKFDRRQYRRIAKGGGEVWIEASYNPVMQGGRTIKIVKYATDITASKYKSLEDASKLDAVSGSMAIIEFTPDGNILTANENFCAAVGYTLEDIKGRHHRIFCDPSYVSTPQYAKFWQDLAAGHGSKGEFRRIGKGGKDVWIQACYNPVFNGEGKVYKVIKLATDLTERMNALSKVANAIRAVSEGDLSIQLSESFVPTMEALRKDFNAAVEVLARTMTSVRDSSESLLSSTTEIKQSAADLSHRTEAQAAAVEEAAAALEEITTTVGDSAKRGDEVGQLMDGARKQAVVSSEIVGQAIRAMGEIEQSSKQISKILGVIDNIAFQTNLLALNAGVEAARAGDAGKGFAVVAQEVRDLAQRSGEAAKEIRKLISLSDNQVSRGVGLVGQTGEALNAILSQVTAISDNVNAIAASTREQSNALGEINASVGSIDQENQKNAAMVEETTAATFSLGQEIQNLFDLVGRFRLGGDRTQPAAYRAAS